jgi:hypothetical protein
VVWVVVWELAHEVCEVQSQVNKIGIHVVQRVLYVTHASSQCVLLLIEDIVVPGWWCWWYILLLLGELMLVLVLVLLRIVILAHVAPSLLMVLINAGLLLAPKKSCSPCWEPFQR